MYRPTLHSRYTIRHFIAGWSSPVARQAHNLKVTGSNPVPAPKKKPAKSMTWRALPFWVRTAALSHPQTLSTRGGFRHALASGAPDGARHGRGRCGCRCAAAIGSEMHRQSQATPSGAEPADRPSNLDAADG